MYVIVFYGVGGITFARDAEMDGQIRDSHHTGFSCLRFFNTCIYLLPSERKRNHGAGLSKKKSARVSYVILIILNSSYY